ncbi:hypothetical protein ASG67_10125 [Sphingomonas sp. Leaf339]|uniref:DUF418 domain-containing protein n=1 Tax=Sphingomonas sp. Leaf339 TaxID=1736343 RepID=UPI0006F3F290|nr:DUF418 domain-containing protein [Sphingomonas sp. Leaf339]KQU53170.1 hypothetical protein ASG67_10125 [Sphingomonas sp. Leaf339]
MISDPADPTPPDIRYDTLDVIRGVAVMGILVANLPAFALPRAAYFSPLAWGGTGPADIAIWFANFVLIEGKMRGLFSFLFGASMLLVIDRAGEDGAQVHLWRMATLFLIGCMHLYLIWWGDILSHYALVGGLALMFARLPVRALVLAGLITLTMETVISGVATQMLFDSAPRNTAAATAIWNGYSAIFGMPPAGVLSADIAGQSGGWWAGVRWRWDHADAPFASLVYVGLQTLSAMLFGMAAWRSGFLTGGWSPARYRGWAIWCLGLALPAYALLGWLTIAHGFDQRWVMTGSIFASEPIRMVAVAGYAALIVLLIRPGGRLTRRLAATGRNAFTNYIGTSVLMTFVFGWGLHQFAAWNRATLYLLIPAVWGLMLWWPTRWLARYRYGPLEWVWRAMARLERPPTRR